MKNLVNLEGVKALSKMEQKSINGGTVQGYCSDECSIDSDCGPMRECFTGTCDGDSTKLCR